MQEQNSSLQGEDSDLNRIRNGFEGDEEENDEDFEFAGGDSPSDDGPSLFDNSNKDQGRDSQQNPPHSGKPPVPPKRHATPFLDAFGADLTKAALDGKNDPVIGRESELLRLMHVLCRRKKITLYSLVILESVRVQLLRGLLRESLKIECHLP